MASASNVEAEMIGLSLWKSVESAFLHQSSPHIAAELDGWLKIHQRRLEDPLRVPKRSSEHREQVKSGSVVYHNHRYRAEEKVTKQVEKLSDALRLNELVALELVTWGVTESRISEQKPLEVAVSLYHAERLHILRALRDIIKGCRAENVTGTLRMLFHENVDTLIRRGLVDNLCRGLRELNPVVHPLPKEALDVGESMANVDAERCAAAECLYHLYFVAPASLFLLVEDNEGATEEPMEGIVKLLMDMSSSLLEEKKHLAEMKREAEEKQGVGISAKEVAIETHVEMLSRATNFVMLAVIAALGVLSSGDMGQGRTMRVLLSNMDFLQKLHDIISSEGWVDGSARSVVALAWSCCLHNARPHMSTTERDTSIVARDSIDHAFTTASSEGCFQRLKELTVVGRDDVENGACCIDTMNVLVVHVLKDLSRRVRQLKDLEWVQFETMEQYHRLPRGRQPPDPEHNFEALLDWMAVTYRDQPELAVQFLPASGRAMAEDGFAIFHEFLRFAGERLTAPLLVAYTNCLSALACDEQTAFQVYNFLKSSSNPNVSWDHLFAVMRQYREMMKESTSQGGMHGEIAKEEEEGLAAMIRILTRVLHFSSDARETIHNQSHHKSLETHWNALNTLFDLVCCPVHPSLKAQLFHAIAAFTLSPRIAGEVWQQLERRGILPDVGNRPRPQQQHGKAPPALSANTMGMRFELEEVESREEEYPETRAFVALLGRLMGYLRTPPLHRGGLPGEVGNDVLVWRTCVARYARFVQEDVFSKVRNDNSTKCATQSSGRAYVQPSERWKVAVVSLRVMLDWIAKYSPEEDPFDFQSPKDLKEEEASKTTRSLRMLDSTSTPSKKKEAKMPHSPAYDLLVDVLSGRNLLEQILLILRPGVADLEASSQSEGVRHRETAILMCLRILEAVLLHQEQFIDAVHRTTSMLLTSLDNRLMADQSIVATIAEYAMYQPFRPLVNVAAVRVLHLISLRQLNLVDVFTEKDQWVRLMTGYAEQLELPPPADLVLLEHGLELEMYDTEAMSFKQDVRSAILELLLDALNSTSSLNLAHLLLGFNIMQDISETDLVLAERGGDPSNPAAGSTSCLHAVLRLLRTPHFRESHAELAESCYKLVYRLCANRATSRPIMQYLRHRSGGTDFFMDQLAGLTAPILPKIAVHQLNQRAWLLKSIALEIHLASLERGEGNMAQRSHTQKLLGALFHSRDKSVSEEMVLSAWGSTSGQLDQLAQQQMIMLEVLDRVAMVTRTEQPPKLHRPGFLVGANMEACLRKDERGVVIYDIPSLHRVMLAARLRFESAPGVDQQTVRPQCKQAIQDVLVAVAKHNHFLLAGAGRLHAFEAWRQVVEVTLNTSYEQLPTSTREMVLLELLMALLRQLQPSESETGVAQAMAAATLTVMTKLREHRAWARRAEGDHSPRLTADQCRAVCSGLLTGIMRQDSTRSLRGNLYVALLNLLRYTQYVPPTTDPEEEKVEDDEMHFTAFEEEQHSLAKVNVAAIRDVGEPLVDVVCGDACNSHGAWSSAASALLDALVALEESEGGSQLWLTYMVHAGFVKSFVTALQSGDLALRAALEPHPKSTKPLYVFESRVSLLMRIAQSDEGARALFDSGLLRTLTACRFLDMRPEDTSPASALSSVGVGGSWIPSARDRYRLLLLPSLQLMVAVCTALPANVEVAGELAEFVLAHRELFGDVLKAAGLRAFVQRGALLEEAMMEDEETALLSILEELRWSTAIFRHLALHPLIVGERLAPGGNAAAFRGLLVALVPKLAVLEGWRMHRSTRASKTRGSPVNGTLGRIASASIAMAQHLMAYMWASGGAQPQDLLVQPLSSTRYGSMVGSRTLLDVFFAPNLDGALAQRARRSEEDVPLALPTQSREASLGSLVRWVRGKDGGNIRSNKPQFTSGSEELHALASDRRNAALQTRRLNDLPVEDLRHLAGLKEERWDEEVRGAQWTQEQMVGLARDHLEAENRVRDTLIVSLLEMMEMTMAVLHAHFQCFLQPSHTSHMVPSGEVDTERFRRDALSVLGATIRRLAKADEAGIANDKEKTAFVCTIARKLRELLSPSV